MGDNSDKENENEPSGSNIKVVVKVRPLLQKEIDERLTRHWNLDLVNRQVWGVDTPRFIFDDVFDENSNTQHLYDQFARPIVEATVNGINGTIFAYGQTASGKTYTIMGNKSSPGIIPLAIHNIFNLVKLKSDRDFLIRVSFIEIYNEKIKDLLDLSNTDLKIREDYNGFISVTCKEQVATSPEQVLDIMYEGNQGRSVGETIMNENSSRSHSIFQIIIESRKHVSPESESDVSVNVSQLNLVDLAGSERAWQAGNTKSFREGCHINKSLTTLSLVIRQLSNNEEINRFVNYRDSKLTRILQSSLGGNAKTGIICTITPTSFEESHSTLKFAMCAKAVQNKPKVNTVSDATQLKLLSKHIESLKKELELKKNLEEDNLKLQQKISKLSAQILMGNKEVVKRNTNNRRQTWWGQLTTISENGSQSESTNNRNFPNLIKNNLRHSNLTEKTSSIWGDRDSLASSVFDLSFDQNKKSFSEDVVILDSDDELNDKTISGSCSPNHRCFDVTKTPPCILRAREKAVTKELKELQEMTSLEKQYGSSVTEYIKEAKESKIKLQETVSELETLKINESNLNSQIESLSKSNKEFENMKIQMHKQINDLKCENEGLSYQLETSKKTHKAREKELLMSLEDARKSTNLEKSLSNNASSRMSQIPILLPEIRKKENNDENYCNENIEQHPAFIQKQKELQVQMESNNSLKQKIEEFEYKLNVSNDQLQELSKKNNDLLSKINELQINLNTKDHTISDYEQQISACEKSISDLLKNPSISSNKTPEYKIFPEIRSLISEYVRINEENIENEQIFNNLKEKIINLENTNNEIILKVDNLTRNIFDLCPILNANSDSLQINLKNVDISLFDFLKNIVKIAKSSYDLITKTYNRNNSENSANDAYTSIIEPEMSNVTVSSKSMETFMESSKTDDNLTPSIVTRENNVENVIKNADLSESIKYLEDMLVYFEKRLMRLLPNPDKDTDNFSFEKPANIECSPIFNTICFKFKNIDHLYQLFMEETDKRFSSLENENIKMVNENQSLKLELQNGLRSIRELLLESELLHKKVLSQRNKQQIMNAEFSLMTSHVNAVDHYHGCLHATCDSTFSYIKEQLIQLQTCLQSCSVTNDITTLLETSYDDLFSTQSEIIDKSSQIFTDDTINCSNDTIQKQIYDDNKEKLDTANKLIESKILENKSLNEKIQVLQNKITTLENENGALSDELMEYLQEADNINKNLNKEYKNVSINTSVISERKLILSPVKMNQMFISQIENDLINIFNLLKIDFMPENDSTDVKIDIFKKSIKKCLIVINEIFMQQTHKSEMFDKITKELELKSSMVNEMVLHSDQVSKQLQDSIDNNSKINSDLQSITSKYDVLLKTESELRKLNIEYHELINNLNLNIEHLKSELSKMNETSDSKQSLVKELEEKIETLNNEMSRKNTDLHTLTAQIKISNEKITAFETSDTKNTLETEFDNALQIIEQKKSEVYGLEHKISEMKREFEDMCIENSYKDKKINELENEIKILGEKLRWYSDVEIRELNLNIEELEVELLSTKQNCESKQKNIDDLIVQVDHLNSEMSSKDTNLQLLTNQIHALNDEISVYKANGGESKLKTDLENALQNVQQKSFEIDELNNKLSEIENTLLQNSNKDNKIIELENCIKNLEEKLEFNLNDSNVLNLKINELEVELLNMRQNLDMKQKYVDELIMQLDILNEKNSTCKTSDEEYKLKIDKLNDKLLESKFAFDNISTELSGKTEKVSELEAQIKILQSKLNSENQLISHLENENSTIQNTLSSFECNMVKKEEEIELLKQKLDSNESLAVKLDNEIRMNINQKDLIAKLEEQLKKSEQDKLLKEKNNEQARTESELKMQSQMALQINIYEQKIVEYRGRIESFESQNNIKDAKIQQMEEYISRANKEFRQNCEQETLSKLELQNQIKTFQNEIILYKEKLLDYDSKLLNSEKYNQESKQLLFDKQSEINQLKQYINQSNMQLSNMKQNMKTMEDKIEKLKNDCKLYICQINSKSSDESKLKDELKTVKVQRNLLETNVKSYEYENNLLKATISDLEKRYNQELENKSDSGKLESTIKKLNNQIFAMRNEDDSKSCEIDKLQFEVKSLINQIKEYKSKELEFKESLEILQNEKIAIEKKLEEAESKTNIGANKNLGVNTEFMEYFVDKMTYEMEQEKRKQLQNVNNELQLKNKDLLAEMRRLRHSLQNNTLSNLMPNDRHSNSQKEFIEQLQSQLSEKDNLIKKLNAMQNEDYKSNKKLINAENQCTELYKENAMLKARLSNCEMELEESKENSQLQERKKRRQSLYDTNRGCHSPMSNIKNDNEKNTLNNKQYELEKENVMLHKNINDLKISNQELQNQLQTSQKNISDIHRHQQGCQNCLKNDHLIKELERIKIRNSDLEAKLLARSNILSPTNKLQPYIGSEIVMSQKICEYIAENQRLQEVNTKLKALCRIRDKKIKELESVAKSQ